MIQLEKVLSEFPVFSSLNRATLVKFCSLATVREVKKGEVVYEEGKAADNLYILLSGRMKVYTHASMADERVLDYLYRGTCFGIISLLTGDAHTVTAEAANDSIVAFVHKEAFLQFLKKYPALSMEFSNMLSRRVKKRTGRAKDVFESMVICVYGTEERMGVTMYSAMLAKAFREESYKKTIMVELRKDKNFIAKGSEGTLFLRYVNEHNIRRCIDNHWGFDYLKIAYEAHEAAEYEREVPSLLGLLTQMYSFIIIDLPPELNVISAACLVQSDSIHCFCRRGWPDGKLSKQHLSTLHQEHPLPEGKIKVILQDPPPPYRPLREFDDTGEAFATIPYVQSDIEKLIQYYPQTEYAQAVRGIAREISQVRIGLALGSGAAFGLAHIGVLKVFEENAISIDIISGSSMGAIVGALWSLGKNADEIKELMKEFHRRSVFSLWDLGNLTRSVLKGRNFQRAINTIFKNYSAYDLKIPVSIMAFDFKNRTEHVMSKNNLLREALLASCAMPGTFEPVFLDQKLLLDGGVLSPVPIDVLIRQNVKKIISVCVTPTKEEARITYEKMPRELNIFDFIFGSIEAIQDEFIREDLLSADVVIHPNLEHMVWTDFAKIDEFVRKGEEEALKYVEKIKALQKS